MTKKKSSPPQTERIRGITLEQVHELWPKSEDGRLAARLLQRYFYSLAIETALGADCNAVSAQAEASANKMLARVTKDFDGIADMDPPPAAPGTGLRELNRFKTRAGNEPAKDSKPENTK